MYMQTMCALTYLGKRENVPKQPITSVGVVPKLYNIN